MAIVKETHIEIGVPRLVPKQQNKQTIPGYDKGFIWDHFN
jgi:hypothetical protein